MSQVHEVPTYEQLRHIDRSVLCGLLAETATPVWEAPHANSWERSFATWHATRQALRDAKDGRRPAAVAAQSPRWLSPLVRDSLGRHGSPAGFQLIRLLQRLRLVDLEIDDNYVLTMVNGLGGGGRGMRPSDVLRNDPDLIERALWRVFEVEGGGEVSLANKDKYKKPGESWQQAFLQLVADRTLPRRQVMDACLAALQADFSSYRAGWYSAMYAALHPTIDEHAQYQPRYRALLRSPVGATVAMSVRSLRNLSRAGLLDDEPTIAAVAPALLAKAKGTALEALRLVADIIERKPALDDLTGVISTALENPHGDVQRLAVRLLRRLGAADIAVARAVQLEPSVRQDLGVETAPSYQLLTTASIPLRHAPRLAAHVERDLVERLAMLLEDARDPLEVELALAGLAGLDDTDLLRPLQKRAAKSLLRGPREGVVSGWLRGQLCGVILRALGEGAAPLPVALHSSQFLLRRIGEVDDVLARRRPPMVLLATPESADGWVSADALISRLSRAQPAPAHHDLIAALLRLHPSGRAEALASCRLDGELGQVVRYALGSSDRAAFRVATFSHKPQLPTPAWWVAAARARNPIDVAPLLIVAGLSGAGQGRPIEATLSIDGTQHPWHDARGDHTYTTWRWNVGVKGAASKAPADQPTAATGWQGSSVGWESHEDWVGWLATIWPHDAEHFSVDLSAPVLGATQGPGVRHDASRVLDALARHPGRLGAISVATLAAGLAASTVDQRVRAVDGVLGLMSAERISADSLSASMALLAAACTATRWATSLQDMSVGGANGSTAVVDILTGLLPQLPREYRGLYGLLGTLYEGTLRCGRAVTDPQLRHWLTGITGSSRAAEVARSLNAL